MQCRTALLNLSRDVGADEGFAKWWPINGNNVRWPEDSNTYRLTVKPTVRTLTYYLFPRSRDILYHTHTHTHTQHDTTHTGTPWLEEAGVRVLERQRLLRLQLEQLST